MDFSTQQDDLSTLQDPTTPPLKIRLALRDYWATNVSPVRRAFEYVGHATACNVQCEPDWPKLCAELGKVYEEGAQVIVAVSEATLAWCSAMIGLANRESYAKWTDEMGRRVGGSSYSMLRLTVEIYSGNLPSTSWSNSLKSFVLSIPKVKMEKKAAEYVPLFMAKLLSAFDEPPATEPVHKADNDEYDDDEFCEITNETPDGIPSTISQRGGGGEEEVIDCIPDANTLTRPDMLLLSPPYHLNVQTSQTNITVQCSHSPSLEFLSTYLRKWCRLSRTQMDSTPLIDIKTHQNPFGFGFTYDTLTLDLHRSAAGACAPAISPVTLLHLVEAGLGYKLVKAELNSWYFRRDSPLKDA